MAAPNLVNVTSIYGRTQGATLTTGSNTDILECPSNKVLKINSIIVANIDGTDSADVTVSFYDSSATARYKIASTVAVPADSTLVVIGKDSPIYLEEGDELEARASADNDADICVSYEQLDDA